MTVRSTHTAAAIVAGLTVLAAPAGAGEARAFEAWGHSFTATDTQATRRADTRPDLSGTPRHAYASALAEAGAANVPDAGTRAVRTLNIWGARIEAPAD